MPYIDVPFFVTEMEIGQRYGGELKIGRHQWSYSIHFTLSMDDFEAVKDELSESEFPDHCTLTITTMTGDEVALTPAQYRLLAYCLGTAAVERYRLGREHDLKRVTEIMADVSMLPIDTAPEFGTAAIFRIDYTHQVANLLNEPNLDCRVPIIPIQ